MISSIVLVANSFARAAFRDDGCLAEILTVSPSSTRRRMASNLVVSFFRAHSSRALTTGGGSRAETIVSRPVAKVSRFSPRGSFLARSRNCFVSSASRSSRLLACRCSRIKISRPIPLTARITIWGKKPFPYSGPTYRKILGTSGNIFHWTGTPRGGGVADGSGFPSVEAPTGAACLLLRLLVGSFDC